MSCAFLHVSLCLKSIVREADRMKVAQRFSAGTTTEKNRKSVKRTAEITEPRTVVSGIKIRSGRC